MHDAENAKARPCMDFRTVDPGSIVWKRGGKAGAVIAVPKISVQTPTCACTISVHTAGMLRVDLKLGNRDIHRRFIEWIAAIEAGVRGTDDADDDKSIFWVKAIPFFLVHVAAVVGVVVLGAVGRNGLLPAVGRPARVGVQNSEVM